MNFWVFLIQIIFYQNSQIIGNLDLKKINPRSLAGPRGLTLQPIFIGDLKLRLNYNPKHQVKVDGKMNSKDAGIVGKRLALAAVILSVGFCIGTLFWGISLVLYR